MRIAKTAAARIRSAVAPLAPLLALLSALPRAVASQRRHPLDGLSADEYRAVVDVLSSHGLVTADSRFHQISLKEPPKSYVKSFLLPRDGADGDGDGDGGGLPIPRAAVAYVRSSPGRTHRAEVDLSSRTVLSWEASDPSAGQPMVLSEEFFGAGEIAKVDVRMVAGLARRDLSPDDVYCVPFSAGTYGNPDEGGNRLLKVNCYVVPDRSDGDERGNWWAMPIQGLFVVFDLNTNTALDVVDTGVVPVPSDPWGYTSGEVEERYGRRPVAGTVAGGGGGGGGRKLQSSPSSASSTTPATDAGYVIDGSIVGWDFWRFHYRVDRRPGAILSLVEVNDGGGKWREVAYEVHLSEVFVPYMDPDVCQYYRTYMDSGEYGFGIMMTPLAPGIDCPRSATYLDSIFHDDYGMPLTLPGTMCVFERSTSDPAWRHYEAFAQTPGGPAIPTEGRPATELVFRYASTVGNYDYLVDYVFMQDGTIKVAVGSTGMDATKGAASRSMSDDGAVEETKYGTLIAPNLIAPYHDHYFNFRIDLDVDGESNEFRKAKIRPMDLSEVDNIPRKSMWGVTYETVKSEVDARSNVTPDLPSKWLFVNPGKESGLAHNPGYMLLPDSYIYNVYPEEDMAVKRNAYVEHQLFVTPYDPDQRYAGGEYPFQSRGDDTLMTWTDSDRPIVDTDIVAYYTIGFHHIPRMEDWPVMPNNWGSFQLRPFNFFTHNPAITLDPVVSTDTSIPEMPAIEVEESIDIRIEEDVEDATMTAGFSLLQGLVCFLLGVAVSQASSYVSCKRVEYDKVGGIRPGTVSPSSNENSTDLSVHEGTPLCSDEEAVCKGEME